MPSVCCDHLLQVFSHHVPSVFNLARLAYQHQSQLFINDRLISSASGVQQGALSIRLSHRRHNEVGLITP